MPATIISSILLFVQSLVFGPGSAGRFDHFAERHFMGMLAGFSDFFGFFNFSFADRDFNEFLRKW